MNVKIKWVKGLKYRIVLHILGNVLQIWVKIYVFYTLQMTIITLFLTNILLPEVSGYPVIKPGILNLILL